MLVVALTAVMAVGVINREWIYDYFRGNLYEPASEMARIRDKLKLTEKGEFLINA